MLIKRLVKYLDTPTAEIKLIGGAIAIVDACRFDELNKFAWRRVKSHSIYYAIRRFNSHGGTRHIRMHRQIAGTPTGMVCHHINGHSLDNRSANLINLTPAEHEDGHSFSKI